MSKEKLLLVGGPLDGKRVEMRKGEKWFRHYAPIRLSGAGVEIPVTHFYLRERAKGKDGSSPFVMRYQAEKSRVCVVVRGGKGGVEGKLAEFYTRKSAD